MRTAEARLAEGDPAAAIACIDRALKCAAILHCLLPDQVCVDLLLG